MTKSSSWDQWDISVQKLRNCHEKKIQEIYQGKTFQIVDNREVKSRIIIDRPRGFPVEYSLISNAETKEPIVKLLQESVDKYKQQERESLKRKCGIKFVKKDCTKK